jgi:transposase
LNHRSQQTPSVARLRSIPKVGIRTAEPVAAFIDDPHRFRHAKAVGRYFGLVPCQDQSGDKNRLGHITREGPAVVRRLVAEAAWQAVRRWPTVRAYFERASAATRSGRRSRWWPRRITWCASCGRCWGRRRVDLNQLPLRAMPHWLLRVVEAFLGVKESVPSERPFLE